MKTCIVTMFFNLARSPDATTATRPLEFYIKHGEPTLTLPHFMVIFCDEETKPLIESMRGERPTKYVVKSIFDYEHVKSLLPIIRENRKKVSSVDPRNTPSHFMVTSFKPFALHLAKREVEAETYMWLDFGGSHVLRGFPDAVTRIVEDPRPKITMCYIHYRSKSELYPMSKFLSKGGPCSVSGTSFTLESSYVDRYYLSMMSVIYEQVSQGVGHTEEQAMVYVYDRNPEWFSLYFGDYQSTLTNYHKCIEDLHIMRYCFIENARADCRFDLVREAEEQM